MKNAIKYYYNLDPSTIHQKNNKYYFTVDKYNYVLLEYDDDKIEDIYNLSDNLLKIGVYSHKIIKNSMNSYVTLINDKNYVLLKIFVIKKQITVNDIINFNNIMYFNNNKLKINDWYMLWTNKVDYLEYQINQLGKNYPLIIESFSYYIGLSEIAICLLKNINKNELYYSLGHKRISCDDTTYVFYNPLNIVIDLRIRDICEYYKSCFFNNLSVDSLDNYLLYNNFTDSEACCFLARMLFPTYYFDIYESIISNQVKEEKIKKITDKVNDYEKFIKKIYLLLKSKYNIPSIEWLDAINY